MRKFGRLIHKYTIKDALKDNMIIQLFYEGRIMRQYLEDESLLDKYFDMITNELNKEAEAALKTRFSRLKMLAQTKEAIYAKAFEYFNALFKNV
ncbi:hypothetical protein ACE5D9_02750 [Rickettsia sp. 2024-CO-Wats]|uniref:hypothetical protein n=1 Tax=unclassified Rickettsia TaxID=114295 RepID=UPI00370D3FB2